MSKHTTFDLANSVPALLEMLQRPLDEIKLEAQDWPTRLATSKQHGLGHNLLADEIIPKLLPHLRKLEELAQKAQREINEALEN